MQTTLKRAVTLVGMGLHSGRPARLVLRPATEGGIRFRRVDVTDRDNLIPARFDRVSDTTLCTLLSNAAGVSVGTVEHLMAALAGTGVTHADRSTSTDPRSRSWTAAPSASSARSCAPASRRSPGRCARSAS